MTDNELLAQNADQIKAFLTRLFEPHVQAQIVQLELLHLRKRKTRGLAPDEQPSVASIQAYLEQVCGDVPPSHRLDLDRILDDWLPFGILVELGSLASSAIMPPDLIPSQELVAAVRRLSELRWQE